VGPRERGRVEVVRPRDLGKKGISLGDGLTFACGISHGVAAFLHRHVLLSDIAAMA
jgi:hypothetical protein